MNHASVHGYLICPLYCTWDIESKMSFGKKLSFSSHWKFHLCIENAEAPSINYSCFKSFWHNSPVTIVLVFLQVGNFTDFVDFFSGDHVLVFCKLQIFQMLINKIIHPLILYFRSKKEKKVEVWHLLSWKAVMKPDVRLESSLKNLHLKVGEKG